MGEELRSPRPVTRARRNFEASALGSIRRDDLRKLCHGLLLGEGASIESYRRLGDFDEFTASVGGLWKRRRVIVRIIYRPIEQRDVQDAETYVEAVGADEAMLLATEDSGVSLALRPLVSVVTAEETAARITSSPLATWTEGEPAVAVERLELMLRLEGMRLHDPVGLQWVPSVAFNELPSALMDEDIEPQDLLEQKCFRLLTDCFRFRGERFGEARRGQRLPDAVVEWPDRSPCSAMIDCKAAAHGYVMEADHLLRFEDYWQTLDPVMTERGCPLQYLIVVSSHFPGGSARTPHPFEARAEAVMERTGLHLCYVKASDLAWAAALLADADASIEYREALDWHAVLRAGLVEAVQWNALIAEVET